MKQIKPDGTVAFHGELVLRRIDKLPEGVQNSTEAQRPDGSQVIGHSETGHNHVALAGDYYIDPNNPFMAYLVTKGATEVRHEKGGPHQHEAFELLSDGRGETIWEIGVGREYRGSWQKSID